MFEKSRIGIHADSPHPIDKIPKKRSNGKSSIPGLLDFGISKKKTKSKKKAKKTKAWWEL